MTAFIIKSGICMVLFISLYWLFLRKEKLFTFNRYYLIFSILVSMAIPFISFQINIGNNKISNDIITLLNNTNEITPVINKAALTGQESVLTPDSESTTTAQTEPLNTTKTDIRIILLYAYLSGFALMLTRFCRNLLIVNKVYRRSERIDQQWYKIALLEQPVNPYSFLRTVYLNKQDYLENRIGANVLKHELEHIRQSHSHDVIFFEILHIVFWFNPVLLLYKSSARINHEYLADEAVTKSISDMRTYANELINFINNTASVPLTSGFNPSMIRLRLMMLNTNTTRWNKNIRMMITSSASILLLSILSIRPAYPDNQDNKTKKGSPDINEDIVIDEANFRGPDFRQLKAVVILDGRKLGIDDVLSVDPAQIKTIDILTNRKAIRKYGRSARNGAVEITTYDINKQSAPDSLRYKPIYTVNDKVPEGTISIPVSNLFSFSIWTYPIFPNQDLKQWRTTYIMTRDYYMIRGTVVQKDGNPLPDVLLTAKDYPYKVRTDKLGHFLLMDVKPDVLVELSADGYEPSYIKVKKVVYSSDLTITLDKKNESVKSNISTNYKIKDFSGTWKLNSDLSMTPVPRINYVCNIRQYDSDSIILTNSLTIKKGKEYSNTERFAFNTVKLDKSALLENFNSITSCEVDSAGQSFTVTNHFKSSLGISKEYRSKVMYSLSNDNKQMIIRRNYIYYDSSSKEKEFEVLVFDRI